MHPQYKMQHCHILVYKCFKVNFCIGTIEPHLKIWQSFIYLKNFKRLQAFEFKRVFHNIWKSHIVKYVCKYLGA